MRRLLGSAIVIIAATLGWSLIVSPGGTMWSTDPAWAAGGRGVRAPDLRSADAWLNTDRPLSLDDLRGQVVLLDFWTYCCINCMHVFPDLKYLEDKYRDQPFVVVGVHSGKFDQEKDPQNIRQAILRHNISHPVAVDSDYQIWRAYGVQAWPTLVLIDPEGFIAGMLSGEGHRAELDRAISRILVEHRRKGTLAEPMQFSLERESFTTGVLEFPGKLLADADRNRLFISDTNHHRVLVTDLDGKAQAVIGSGIIGLADGPFDKARFHQPQGLALSADAKTLYVADTENHALRAVDLEARVVTTLAGTGEQSHDLRADGPGRKTRLSSPWDLARVDDRLFIAMAGTHQIWVYDLHTKRVSVFAGTGREARIDGPNRGAAFAQPSGLAIDGEVLYVADSEISTIRAVEIKPGGETRTVAGSGGLFEFGLRDGVGQDARFQHPLGVVLVGDRLFVADTFNDVIRLIDLEAGRVVTWFGRPRSADQTVRARLHGGEAQAEQRPSGGGSGATVVQRADAAEARPAGEITLSEPGGLSLAGDAVYVADTNHHRIVAVNLETRDARVLNVSLP